MPAISKIRFTNIIYENGGKRFNDEIFEFDGHNGVILLENGGGKTVLIQTALQAILPHSSLGERKIRDTLSLEGGASHIAIEWILNDRPRRYGLTAVSLYLAPEGLKSLRYAYDYSAGDAHSIENIPFTKKNQENLYRSSSKQEIQEYYQYMQSQKLNAHNFDTIKNFQEYIEDNFHIISSEWKNISLINGAEGDVEKFFEQCKTTSQLVDKLLIPIVEEALAGNGTDDFVQIFERQREHFKKHKELRGRIEESKKIEEKIKDYVTIYTKYHELEKKLVSKKAEAKSIYEFLEEEVRKINGEICHIENSQEILNKEAEQLKKKELSYELAKLENQLKKAKDDYETVLQEYNEMKDSLEERETRLQNLEIAELKTNIKQEEEQINMIIKQLNELDDDHETLDFKDRLSENSSILNGYFQQELINLDKQKITANNQKTKYEEELKENNIKSKNLQLKKEELIKVYAGFEGEIKTIKSIMETIKKEILLNPTNESILEEYPKWKSRTQEIERLNLENIKYIKELKSRKETLLREIPIINNQIQNLIKNLAKEEANLGEIHNKHEEMLNMVRGLKIDWQHLNSIYLKEKSILGYMEERLEKIKGEKEKLIEKERLSYRLLDSYGKNEYFTGEPLLENWVNSWKNQFNLLELGSKYIEKIAGEFNKDIDKLYEEYPLWPLVAITSEGEVDKLRKRIESQSKKLIFPILILSQEEATRIILGKRKIEERYVYPFIWGENLDKKKFQIWKEELMTSAKEIVEERKNKEREEIIWNDKIKSLNEFLINYPYDRYSQLEENQRELKRQLEERINIIEESETEDKNISNEMIKYEINIKDLEQEYRYLEKNIEKSIDFFQREVDIENKYNQLFKKDEELKIVNKEIGLNEINLKTRNDIVKSIEWEIREIDEEISKILGDFNYKDVKSFKAIYKNIEKKSILEDREYIKSILSEKQKDRPALERQLKRSTESKEEKVQDLELKYRSAHYPLDESLEYPYNGRNLKNSLTDDVVKLRDKIEKIEPVKIQMEKTFENKQMEYKLREEDYYKVFDEIIKYTEHLFNIKKEISKEKIDLDKKKKYLSTNLENFNKELKDIENHIQNLKIESGKYEFLSSQVKSAILSSDIVQDLPYNRDKVISNIVNEMEELKTNVQLQEKQVNLEKNQFIQFLNENPIEIRLREMTLSGIRNKDDFHQVLEWKSNMEKTLNRVVKIYEKNIMEHDKELNQFIQYLYAHLATLASEISSIPKNTKIKIDDKWKEIYQIQVPSWDENKGKEEIRKHVDWMISKLEGNEFLDDEGNEDKRKIKTNIESWLQPKQLLNIIMLGEEIKVRCRKVTNDGKISNIYYSWSSSNQWSGGEKWSKNMALFLGILNYSAEKKQHILSSKKRNRTVIMDNPFGKASSDHVLSPVFFIAEQLGFQFIVLTAHGDGKYIRDYFPIVYSCKLRSSREGDTSILTKEKIINHAFLRDHDPMSVERLGEKQQLSLFQ